MMKKTNSINFKVFILLIIFILSTSILSASDQFSTNVMAPLHVMNYNDPKVFEIPDDWNSFENELAIAKSMGIDAVSVDVWWGDVEKDGDELFNWSYYNDIFSRIKNAGLKIIPIMSFHQCGGNVGDTYTSTLPAWIWNKIKKDLTVEDMKYKSELGNYSDEYVTLWADDRVLYQYKEFMDAFILFCYENVYADNIEEINISCGPAGELRYPSYNSHDWVYDLETGNLWELKDQNGNIILRGDRTNWPHRGALQCYGKLAASDFRRQMKIKYYDDIESLKTAWGKHADGLTSFDQIALPNEGTDHGYPDGKIFNADVFFSSGDYYKTEYGKDLIEWYNNSLVNHGRRMISTAKKSFNDKKFRKISLGIKVPGIHWQMGTLGETQAPMPRAAEITTGLLNLSNDFMNSFDLVSDEDTNGHGYANIISVCNNHHRKVVLHFTCLEMGNNQFEGMGETPNQYSLAKALVGWFATEAYRQNVTLKGENALSGGLPWVNEDFPGDWIDAWDHIDEALDRYPYKGITILRMTDVTTVKNPQTGVTVGKNHYETLITKYKNYTPLYQNITIHLTDPEWIFFYGVIALDNNKSNYYPLKYNGFIDGKHCWEVSFPATNYFKYYLISPKLNCNNGFGVYTRYPNAENDIPTITTDDIVPINDIYIDL